MALRIRSVGLGLEASGSDLDCFGSLERNPSWILPARLARAVRQAINNQLITDMVKGNPTV